MNIFKESANNAVVLSGDSHDTWAFTLTESGDGQTGAEVGINLGVTGVSSPGWGRGGYMAKLFEMGWPGKEGWDLMGKVWSEGTPGLQYADVRDNGFIAVKVTKTEHVANFIYLNEDPDSQTTSLDVLSKPFTDYGLTAPFYWYSLDVSALDVAHLVQNEQVRTTETETCYQRRGSEDDGWQSWLPRAHRVLPGLPWHGSIRYSPPRRVVCQDRFLLRRTRK